MAELAGRVALITGASRGIGRGIADVMLTARNSEALSEAAGKARLLGHKAAIHAADLTANVEPAELVAALTCAFGRLDILVNNAGGTRRGRRWGLPDKSVCEQMTEVSKLNHGDFQVQGVCIPQQ